MIFYQINSQRVSKKALLKTMEVCSSFSVDYDFITKTDKNNNTFYKLFTSSENLMKVYTELCEMVEEPKEKKVKDFDK